MKVSVCTPSRGLIFSYTVESIIYGMQELTKLGIGSSFYTSRDLPIPDGHNYTLDQSFQDQSVDRILFIEEDMYVPTDAFIALVTSEFPIVTLQYNDKNGSPHGIIHYNGNNEILWCGLGATKIDRKVFDDVGRPYFRTDTRYKVVKKHTQNGPIVVDFEELETKSDWQYGGLDVDFYTRARKKGYKIECLKQYKAHHFNLKQLGEPQVNNGCHLIQQV